MAAVIFHRFSTVRRAAGYRQAKKTCPHECGHGSLKGYATKKKEDE
jgi:hypothetical protein